MGGLISMVDEYFPPAPKWSVDDIPDLTGQVMIVTGGNTGIGKETVEALLKHNAKVYLAARSKVKAEEAIQDLRVKTGKDAIWLKLDLADLKSIKAAVEEFTSKEKELHVLFNNAGVMMPELEDLTIQGYDLQFGTNVLGHFFLTKLLLPTLISTAQNSPSGKVRVVNTSSSGHTGRDRLDFSSFRDFPARQKIGSFGLYLQSKLGNVVFSNELARRYGEKGIVSVSLNPGNLTTDLQRTTPRIVMFLAGFIFYPVQMGALTQLRAGTSPEGVDFNGKYLKPWARIGESSPASRDPTQGEELWKWLEEQVKNI
ncbi:NAD(P)-binding protein [Dendrothele bispora CBS 962.96]|uniref:NAD(P)-binding protein n=1 Tax=Dendrothele bispora (strain CBS 962.96) TaxID=1314807 RepID=A0A4S8KXH2_DENBC|nr:NAD(P)-binding protein [Dendrothele bispora CBS 962.96]